MVTADLLAGDEAEARQYGAAAAQQLEWLGRSWDEVAPLLASGWVQRHAAVCQATHDWRVAWPRVREGWREARRA